MHTKLIKFAFHIYLHEAFQISIYRYSDTRGKQNLRTTGARKRRQYHGYQR